jgi:predicted O-methyltransferase YrrM
VLELGTFTGYSALCFAEALPTNGMVHTIEENDELEDFAQNFFAQSPHGYKITQHIGKVLDIIPNLDLQFDLVFLDADKREYSAYYYAVFEKIPSGGIILADNTLWNGKVACPITSDDKQTQALTEFNRLVANDSRVETVIIPLRDGLTLIRKK